MGTSVFNTADFRSTVAEVCDPGLYGEQVRVTLRNGAVELMATDGIAGIRCRLGGTVAQEVAVHLPAAVLRSVVGALPADEIRLEFGQSVTIASGSASFELSVLAEELPDWQESLPSLSVDGARLAQGLGAVEYAAVREARGYYLRGICIDLDGETLTLVATDGHRLALYRIDGVSHAPLRRVIRLADTGKLSRMARQGGSIALAFEQGSVLAATDQASLVCPVLDGHFPDYRRVIPSIFAGEIVPDTAALIQALKRVALTADEFNRAVALSASGDRLTLSATSALGTSSERVAVESFSGEPFEASYNAKYLREAVVKAAGPVRLRFSGAPVPLLVEAVESPAYKALLMPVVSVR